MTAKEYIILHGWTYTGNCNCSNRYTEKFELKVDVGEYEIKLSHSNFLISTPTNKFKRYKIKELKPIIDEIFANHKTGIQKKTKIQSVSE